MSRSLSERIQADEALEQFLVPDWIKKEKQRKEMLLIMKNEKLFMEAWSGATAETREKLFEVMLEPVRSWDKFIGFTIPKGRGADARAVEMNDDGMLPAQRSTAQAGGGGSQISLVDEAGGRAVCIHIGAPQQSDHGSAAADRTANLSTAIVPAGDVPPGCTGSLHRGITFQGIGNARARKHGGSQAPAVDEAGGRAVYIHIDVHAPQQSGQGSVAATRTTNDGVEVQQVLSTVFGGLVVLSVTNLHGTSKGEYPEFIKSGLFFGCVLLIGLTFLGLVMKNEKNIGKAATRVAAGMAITAMTIAAVYQVSEKVYIRCIIGIIGAMVTLAMAVINWR